MKIKTKLIANKTGRNALRGEIMTGRQKHVYEVGGNILGQPKPEIRHLIKEIERILGRAGYRRFMQLGFPGEFRASYVKGNRIITISDIPEAYELKISSIKNIYAALKWKSKEKIKEGRKKLRTTKNIGKKKQKNKRKKDKK